MSLLRSLTIHCGFCAFYQHAMPNGILKTNNAVRHDMLVACNEHPRASKLHWSDVFN